jgi:predicted permease
MANLRYTLRALSKNPGFAAVALLSLALGIGANTAIFTLIDALLLREVPVRQPERLVELSVVRRGEKIPFSYPMFRELERGQRVFSGLIGWSYGELSNVEVNGVLSQAYVNEVSGNYYSELGVSPLLGRLIARDDANRGGSATASVAVLGYEFWQGRFGGAWDVLGKQIAIEGQPFTIIGVTQKWFTGMTPGEPPELTTPMKADDNRALLWVRITGRLRDGVGVAQAQAQLRSFWPAVLLATASTNTAGLRRQTFLSMGLDVASGATGVARDLRARFTRPLYVLLGIVGLILLVACVNLANLMLARAAARSHEMTVRVALGASRWVLAWQVLTESLALSIAGALGGLALAYWGSRLLVVLMMQGHLAPVAFDLRPDWRVLSLTAAVAIFTGILFGIAPAWRCSREDPAAILQRNPRSLAGAAGRLGKGLMATQVALSLVMLLGASLLVRSFRQLASLDLGFDERVITFGLNPRPGGAHNLDVNSYHRQLIERVSHLAGVLSVSLADQFGPGRGGWQENASTMAAISDPNQGVMTNSLMVSPGFLRTLGVRLLRGRDFDWSDDGQHPHVAIVSSSLAARLFPSGDAIGQLIRFSFMPELQNLRVVGVAGSARLFDLRDSVSPVIYLSGLQYPGYGAHGVLLLRARGTPEAVASAVGREVESLGREYVLSTSTVQQQVSDALSADRVIAILSGFFASLALLLASVGLYGLASYTVTRRTREIGIRTALGAQPSAILWAVLRNTLTLAAFGIGLGIPCALGASRLIASMLFGVSPGDLSTVIFVSVLLLAVALLAGYVPARRASRIDPMMALRTE